MVKNIGFLINPIAGMGGRVGLKGTDGVSAEARRLGAEPVAPERAAQALAELARQLPASDALSIRWLTCSGSMGQDELLAAGFSSANIEVTYTTPVEPTAEDTRAAAAGFLARGVDLIVFCGGDGSARDICEVVGSRVPILGIPSGVKMYSGVFGTSPARTAEILLAFLQGSLTTAQVDVLDLDEAQYRDDTWQVRLYHCALTPFEPSYTQSAKALIDSADETQVKQAIAESLYEQFADEPDALILLGPGSSVRSLAQRWNVTKTLLGIDAIANGTLIASDLNESRILTLLESYSRRFLILSPIGAQGFVLGRGNLQLSPAVIRAIGCDNIIIIATPAKLARTPILRFDTGDRALDQELTRQGYVRVLTGYRRRRLVKAMV
jgi:predicted polyphosphate/ATP-dependent NAD kinase